MTRKIKLGLPKGSLNNVGRGDTQSLLLDAGYKIRGYTPGNERGDQLRIENDPEIEAFLVRPQNAPGDLDEELLDIAITGKDWVREEASVTRPLMELANLEYGMVKVVAAVRSDSKVTTLTDLFLSGARDPMIWYTEYPKLARDYFLQNLGYQQLFGDEPPFVRIRGFKDGTNVRVRIIYSEGATEEYLRRGFPVVDNVQSGGTLERAGGKILEDGEMMTSSAGLYGRPTLSEDPWILNKAVDVRNKLVGVVTGRKYDDVKFNIPPTIIDSVVRYVAREKLAIKGPTKSDIVGPNGKVEGYAINIIVPKERYPEVSATLKARYDATGIVRSDIKQLIL